MCIYTAIILLDHSMFGYRSSLPILGVEHDVIFSFGTIDSCLFSRNKVIIIRYSAPQTKLLLRRLVISQLYAICKFYIKSLPFYYFFIIKHNNDDDDDDDWWWWWWWTLILRRYPPRLTRRNIITPVNIIFLIKHILGYLICMDLGVVWECCCLILTTKDL